jgi:hypothetical protein
MTRVPENDFGADMADGILSRDLITYDPLSETTRKERTSLLGLSMLGVALVKVPLVPEKFSALGIDFAHINQTMFVRLYSLVVSYYVVAFAVYAVSDYVAWRRKEVITAHEYEQQTKDRRASSQVDLDRVLGTPDDVRYENPRNGRLAYRGAAGYWLAFWIARLRAAFEFLFPLGFAAYSVGVLLSYAPK